MQQNLFLGAFFAISTTVLSSLASTAAKITGESVSPFFLVWLQFVICIVLLTPWAIRNYSLPESDTRRLHITRGIAGWAGFVAYYSCLPQIPLVDAALLRQSAPICLPLLLFLTLGIRVSRTSLFAALTGFAGIALILKPGAHGVSFWHMIGFTSGLALAISMVTTRLLTKGESTRHIMYTYFLIGFTLSSPLAFFNFHPLDLKQTGLVLFVGFSMFTMMWMYTKAYSYAKASVLAPLSYLSVVFSGLLGWIIWQHKPDTLAMAGICLAVSGGIVSILGENKLNNTQISP